MSSFVSNLSPVYLSLYISPVRLISPNLIIDWLQLNVFRDRTLVWLILFGSSLPRCWYWFAQWQFLMLLIYTMMSSLWLCKAWSIVYSIRLKDIRCKNGCLMTKNLYKSIKFEDRYYIFYISSGYIDLWRFFVIKHPLKDKQEESLKRTLIASARVYILDKVLY